MPTALARCLCVPPRIGAATEPCRRHAHCLRGLLSAQVARCEHIAVGGERSRAETSESIFIAWHVATFIIIAKIDKRGRVKWRGQMTAPMSLAGMVY